MGVRIKSKAIQNGWNFDQGQYRDDMYVRCSRCGWICNLDRDIFSHPGGYEGWGTTMVPVYGEYDFYRAYDSPIRAHHLPYDQFNSYDSATDTYDDLLNANVIDTYDNLVLDTMDAVVTAGCPQCGTLLYNDPSQGTKG